MAAPPRIVRLPLHFDPAFDPRRTSYLTRKVESWGHFEAAGLKNGHNYHDGYMGQDDHWMEPILRPGALVLVDPQRQRIEAGGGRNEAERPIYIGRHPRRLPLLLVPDGKGQLVLQPHPLSTSVAEAYRFPDEAEVVGQVVGVSMRLVAD